MPASNGFEVYVTKYGRKKKDKGKTSAWNFLGSLKKTVPFPNRYLYITMRFTYLEISFATPSEYETHLRQISVTTPI